MLHGSLPSFPHVTLVDPSHALLQPVAVYLYHNLDSDIAASGLRHASAPPYYSSHSLTRFTPWRR
jgi:hypothetical protein